MSNDHILLDDIDWDAFSEWRIHSGSNRYIVRTGQLTGPTYEYSLFNDRYVSLFAHYTSKDKLVGYSLGFTNWRQHWYVERPWYVLVYTDINVQNKSSQQLYADKQVRLYKFNRKYPNYAFAIRWRVEKEVELEV